MNAARKPVRRIIRFMAVRSSYVMAGLLVAFALASCQKSAPPQGQSQLDRVLQRDKLIVGVYSTSPPLSFVDEQGRLQGFEVDLARLIAKDLLGDPNKVEFVILTSEGRFPAVMSGKVDLGICSTTITGDRAARMAFTQGYLDTGGSVLARRDSGLTRVMQLNDSKYTYAILNVPSSIERAKALLPRAHLLILDSPSALFMATKTGRATAFPMDKPIADYYRAGNQDLVNLDTSGSAFSHVSNDAIFMKPGDFKWWLFLNTWVGELRNGSRYQEYADLYRKWLKKDPPPQRFYDYGRF